MNSIAIKHISSTSDSRGCLRKTKAGTCSVRTTASFQSGGHGTLKAINRKVLRRKHISTELVLWQMVSLRLQVSGTVTRIHEV